jgi:hypothetical protein
MLVVSIVMKEGMMMWLMREMERVTLPHSLPLLLMRTMQLHCNDRLPYVLPALNQHHHLLVVTDFTASLLGTIP